jgi:hypothetical protein
VLPSHRHRGHYQVYHGRSFGSLLFLSSLGRRGSISAKLVSAGHCLTRRVEDLHLASSLVPSKAICRIVYLDCWLAVFHDTGSVAPFGRNRVWRRISIISSLTTSRVSSEQPHQHDRLLGIRYLGVREGGGIAPTTVFPGRCELIKMDHFVLRSRLGFVGTSLRSGQMS